MNAVWLEWMTAFLIELRKRMRSANNRIAWIHFYPRKIYQFYEKSIRFQSEALTCEHQQRKKKKKKKEEASKQKLWQVKLNIRKKKKTYFVVLCLLFKIREREAACGRQKGRSPVQPAPEHGFWPASSGVVRRGFTCKPHNTGRLQQNREVDNWSKWPQEKSKPSLKMPVRCKTRNFIKVQKNGK